MTENIFLKWTNYSSTFIESLKVFQTKERLCDSTIVCQGKFYPIHRLVLSLSSEYFEDIYEKTPCRHPFIIVKDIEPALLEALLSFIYQGEVQVASNELPDFMKAAEALKIRGLVYKNSNVNNEKCNNNRNTLCDNSNLNSRISDSTLEEIVPNIGNNVNEIFGTLPLNENQRLLQPKPISPASITVNKFNSIKSAKKWIKIKKLKAKAAVKAKKNKSVNELKINMVKKSHAKAKASKARNPPSRKSPRETVPKSSYYTPEDKVEELDSEAYLKENQAPQMSLTIASYSGGNNEEFDNSPPIIDDEMENIASKVETTADFTDDESYDFDNDLPSCTKLEYLENECDALSLNGPRQVCQNSDGKVFDIHPISNGTDKVMGTLPSSSQEESMDPKKDLSHLTISESPLKNLSEMGNQTVNNIVPVNEESSSEASISFAAEVSDLNVMQMFQQLLNQGKEFKETVANLETRILAAEKITAHQNVKQVNIEDHFSSEHCKSQLEEDEVLEEALSHDEVYNRDISLPGMGTLDIHSSQEATEPLPFCPSTGSFNILCPSKKSIIRVQEAPPKSRTSQRKEVKELYAKTVNKNEEAKNIPFLPNLQLENFITVTSLKQYVHITRNKLKEYGETEFSISTFPCALCKKDKKIYNIYRHLKQYHKMPVAATKLYKGVVERELKSKLLFTCPLCGLSGQRFNIHCRKHHPVLERKGSAYQTLEKLASDSQAASNYSAAANEPSAN